MEAQYVILYGECYGKFTNYSEGETMNQQPIGWVLFLVVWFSNINDLIRGEWFFESTEQILFWNFVGLLGFILITLTYREKIKELEATLITGLKSKEKKNV